MPGDDRISPLLSALSGGLSQDKLELLSREFSSLAQDRAETLVFFVLQNVCQRLASALEGEAVSVERFQELTAGIADQIGDILRDVQQGNADVAKLEALVVTLFRNLGLFRR
jgi:3-methyladenine DNA glycosylase/8-oxoguanine DNA glycosylase